MLYMTSLVISSYGDSLLKYEMEILFATGSYHEDLCARAGNVRQRGTVKVYIHVYIINKTSHVKQKISSK